MAPRVRSAKRTSSKKKQPYAGEPRYATIFHALQRQRAGLIQGAEAVVEQRPGLAAFPDMNDQATAEADQNFALRIKDRERKLIKKIDEALDRLATRTYGICEGCGEEIPLKRLKARPVTTFCIACKTQQEQEEHSRG
jgi:RNA polymerase-binding transcription factor